MSTRTTTDDLTPTRTPGPRRRRVRVAGVGLLAAVMSLTSLTAGAAVLSSSPWSSSQGSTTSTVDSEPASGAESAGIDTIGTGDEVTALGNAGGTGQLTAADGTVTGLEETITTTAGSGVAGEILESLIETDADVVAGDSGGPLLDDEGEVIGINTQIRTGEETGGVQVGAGAFLGVQVVTAPTADVGFGYGPQDSRSSRSSRTSAATVADVVADGPAAVAGLVAGDTRTAIGRTTVTSAAQVSTLLADHDPGDRVQRRWTDGSGVEHDADATLAPSPVA